MIKPLDLALAKPMTIHLPFEPRQGGSLRTRTRPTLNRRTESTHLYAHCIHSENKSFSDIGSKLILSDPAVLIPKP